MTGDLFIAIMAGLGGMLGYGFADFFGKVTTDKVGDTASLVWGHLFGTLALAIAVTYKIFSGGTIDVPDQFSIWLILAAFGVFQGIVYSLLYRGFSKGKVAILSPVFSSYAGITAVVSILFFKELVSPFVLFGLIVLFAGVLLINTDLSSFRHKKINLVKIDGFKEVGIATLIAGFWVLFWDMFIGNDWLAYTFYMYAFMTLFIVATAKVNKSSLKVGSKRIWVALALVGLGEIAAYLAVGWGYSVTTKTSVITLITGAFSLPVIVLSYLFLKEKVTKTQTVGALIIIAGIVLISIL